MNIIIKNNSLILSLVAIYLLVSVLIFTSAYNYTTSLVKKEQIYINKNLSSISEIRTKSINDWIADKKKIVNSISSNITLQMFLVSINDMDIEEKLSQEQYVLNYLDSEISKLDIVKQKKELKANNPKIQQLEGVAILDSNQKNIVSINLSNSEIKTIIENDLINKKSSELVKIVKNEGGFFIVLAKQINSIQNSNKIGNIILIKRLDEEFFSILNFPPDEFYNSKSELILQDKDSSYQVISTGKKSDSEIINLSKNNSRNSSEIESINNQNKIINSYNRNALEVSSIAKILIKDNLYFIHSVDSKKALLNSKVIARNILIITILVIIAVACFMLLIWRHSTSIKYQRISNELDKKTNLLKLVTDNQLQSMFLVDDKNIVKFANRSFLKNNNITLEGTLEKPLENVIGKAASQEYLDAVNKKDELFLTQEKQGNSSYILRKSIPVVESSGDNENKKFLLVDNDITNLIKERKKYENNLSNVIETLLKIIEQRSPYFLNHSKNLNKISVEIAKEINSNEKILKAVDISAKLCNLYLALLPRELINKESPLSPEEKQLFDNAPEKTLALIKDLEFDSPVIETISQLNERPDGKGENGLTDENIIESAKILKVANDFVAMTSERPYRKKLSNEEAIDILIRQKNTKYSSKIVYALANLLTK